MSSKRAKRHQLIVRASNENRATKKLVGKDRGIMAMWFNDPLLRVPKVRTRNLTTVWMRDVRRKNPRKLSYKDGKTEMFRMAVQELGPRVMKGMGTIK